MAFEKLVQDFARNLARQVADQFEAAVGHELESRSSSIAGKAGRPRGRPPGVKVARKSTKGQTRDMSCRVAGCKTRSLGPSHSYFCAEHFKLPKKERIAAVAKYKEAKAKGAMKV